ncbi:hypothetical protein [Sporosarcina sp. D27]|uniref:hypothetical protein n=1 Tax=Sporosarcina sp. D27 TaxID=1382305 RepID=UPI00046EDA3A|nr:hypothetical protein [Sporosarcina sp. D27]
MNQKVEIPFEMKHMLLLSQIINSDNTRFEILILGENMKPDIRNEKANSVIHLLLYIQREGQYVFENLIESFAFESNEMAYNFLTELPNMSALDLLLKLNGPVDIDMEIQPIQ